MAVSTTISDIKNLDLRTAVIVSPSDTVIGFHARYDSPLAISKIEQMKKRQGSFIVLVSNLDEAKSLCAFAPKQLSIARTYWPGSVTFILNKNSRTGTLALRLPKNAYVHQMLQAFGGPIVSTSCNVHTEPVATSIQEAQETFAEGVDLYLDFPHAPTAAPSTLVDLTTEPFRILRQGSISLPEIR